MQPRREGKIYYECQFNIPSTVLCCLVVYEGHADVLGFCVSYTHLAVLMS